MLLPEAALVRTAEGWGVYVLEDERAILQTLYQYGHSMDYGPDAFYARLTELAATGEAGAIEEVTSPDDNLQAVFRYLVKT